MAKELKTRAEVEGQTTWDLSSLFATEADYEKALKEMLEEVEAFHQKYKGELKVAPIINAALNELRPLREKIVQIGTYVSLQISADQTDEANIKRQGEFGIAYGKVSNWMSFFDSELMNNETDVLDKVAIDNPENAGYIAELLREMPHRLAPEVESAMAQFSQVFDQPYQTYSLLKMADMDFEKFTVDGKEYPQSFVLFENEWEYDVNTPIRHAAYDNFYGKLAEYQNGFASNYQTKVLTEKATATLKGFDSVIDYLLFDQKVTREMYDRQIDVIMEELAPAMRKYAKLLQEIHGLDKMTFADLKLPVDDEYEPEITIEESQKYMAEGLAPLGEEYVEMVNRAFDERWIDFPQNTGKRTGAFCSSPYGDHPYVFISWTERMREVFVLAHELGHAGHFYLAGQNQNIYNVRPSLYFIEAPSTMNELIVAEDMIATATEERMKRWVYASMVSRTYYHNFVTHLLEAAYQREVYRYVDEGKPLSAKVLNTLMLNVYREFWGDAVEIPDYAGLTWMRQPHYFMGLYPYTYSAGLTISTSAIQKLRKGEITLEQWKDVLKAGGTKTPMELAMMVDVDLSTEEPLQATIAYISNMIDSIVEITEKMK